MYLGPWYHGQWGRGKGTVLDMISFGSETGEEFRVLQKKWFDYYLKGIGDGKFEEAYVFQTGSNVWKTYAQLATQAGYDSSHCMRARTEQRHLQNH